ncbi:Kinesin-5 [Exaiptasia diaphana]|nr:Kinesin-5 [Exaiptasia diaphana]
MAKLREELEATKDVKGAKKKTVPHEFSFDRIFSHNMNQESIFEEVSQLVQSALDGYRVCIFAYGQTGSGKTYTMEGDASEHTKRGIIPRSIEHVYMTSEDLKEKGWEYKMEARYLEIYNENIRDLLASDDSLKYEIKMVGNGKTNSDSEVTVTNLKVIPVDNEKQVLSLLKTAAQNRSVGATKWNERSSRSHSLFILKISGENTITDEKCQGTLNLIDLAGSERISQSGAEGKRLKETKNINTSLSNLSNVIMALANKDILQIGAAFSSYADIDSAKKDHEEQHACKLIKKRV